MFTSNMSSKVTTANLGSEFSELELSLIALMLSESFESSLSAVHHSQLRSDDKDFVHNYVQAAFLSKTHFHLSDKELTRNAAIQKFRNVCKATSETNNYLSDVVSSLQSDPPVHPRGAIWPRGVSTQYSQLERILIRARDMLGNWFSTPLDAEGLFQHAKCGPGKSQGYRGASDTNYKKLIRNATWYRTSSLTLYTEYLCWALDQSIFSDEIVKSISAGFKGKCVDGKSKIITVPKNNEVDRVIALEASIDMLFQQSVMHYLYSVMEDHGLDVSSLQDAHRKTALAASVSSLFATIDLSSASDSIGRVLFEYLFPSWLVSLAYSISADKTVVDGEVIPLPMVSTMGNALTFPLQTILFYAISYASAQEFYEPTTRSSFCDYGISTYGDDIIVPNEIYPVVTWALQECGFQVNLKKSCCGVDPNVPGSLFRESCGLDGYKAMNIRPLFLGVPRSKNPEDVYAWLNAFYNKAASWFETQLGVSHFSEVAQIFFSTLHGVYNSLNFGLLFVPEVYPDDSGIRLTPYSARLASLFTEDIGDCRVFSYPTRYFGKGKKVHARRFWYLKYTELAVDVTKVPVWFNFLLYKLGSSEQCTKDPCNFAWLYQSVSFFELRGLDVVSSDHYKWKPPGVYVLECGLWS